MTALGVAWVRAAESQRADRLFDDPLAARFVEASGWDPPDLAGTPRDEVSRALLVLAQSVVVRTRFLDDLLADAWAGGCRQVVILGAGLDARAFRLPWPSGSRCFELDLPPVLDFKEHALRDSRVTPACDRVVVPSDLLADWPGLLLEAGFHPDEPAVWIAEGLLIYFSEAENDRLVAQVGTLSTPGDRFAITFSRPGTAAGTTAGADLAPDPGSVARAGALSGVGLLRDPGAVMALWRWAGPADPAAWLAGHGWDADVFDREERAKAYGRPLDLAEDGSAATRTVLIDARRS
ncbi:MAG TPA: SAM-dependent methyltransferase [Acidimicrobiia bacterium]|nr:SAM-dependent methyltransferase [Acidimicrobiia bacterium]